MLNLQVGPCGQRNVKQAQLPACDGLFPLLVPVFTQALFALVRGHFVPFSLFAAWHGLNIF